MVLLKPKMPNLIYSFDAPFSAQDWRPINDGVMGGVSFSEMQFDVAGHAVFQGNVSLQNGGGFASVRASSFNLGGPGTLAYSLMAWGDGRTYKLNFRTDAEFDGVNFQFSFTPPAGCWSRTVMPVAEFLATYRGREVQGAPSLLPELVTQVGLMISDKQAGPFRLLVKSISAIESTAAMANDAVSTE